MAGEGRLPSATALPSAACQVAAAAVAAEMRASLQLASHQSPAATDLRTLALAVHRPAAMERAVRHAKLFCAHVLPCCGSVVTGSNSRFTCAPWSGVSGQLVGLPLVAAPAPAAAAGAVTAERGGLPDAVAGAAAAAAAVGEGKGGGGGGGGKPGGGARAPCFPPALLPAASTAMGRRRVSGQCML